MNDKKYDGVNHPVRQVDDLRELLLSSEELYADLPAYYTKDRPGGKYRPTSYREAMDLVRALGTSLLDLGLAGQRIGVLGESRLEWVITYFAVVAGVGVIVPLDRNLPDGELRGLIDRSGMSAIVYSDAYRDKVVRLMEDPDTTIRHFVAMDAAADDIGRAMDGELSFRTLLEEGGSLLAAGDTRFLDAEVDPDSMCTLLFTSGTTGAAKGVMLSHRNIATNVMQLSAFFNVPEPKIGLSILPLHHAYEMTCHIWTAFYQGAAIAFCEGFKYLQKNLLEIGPSVMLGVPLVFEKLYKSMWKQARKNGQEKKLRRAIDLSKRFKLYQNPWVVKRMFAAIHANFGGHIGAFIEGGAPADPFIIEEFEAMGIPLIQGYGMSECAPIIALNRDRYRKAGPVGQAVPGMDIRIMSPDEDGIGEVVVRSPSVMLGYFEDKVSTAKVMQNGWLRTGDLGYLDEEGFLWLTGRSKTVIVTKGGKNIYPEEVETVLMKEPLIKEVLVYGAEDERVGNVVVSAEIYPDYDRLKAEVGDLPENKLYSLYQDLVERLNREMPAYKNIHRIHLRTSEFLKTTTGKIKRYGNITEEPDPPEDAK